MRKNIKREATHRESWTVAIHQPKCASLQHFNFISRDKSPARASEAWFEVNKARDIPQDLLHTSVNEIPGRRLAGKPEFFIKLTAQQVAYGACRRELFKYCTKGAAAMSFFLPFTGPLRPSFPGDELTRNRWVPTLSAHNSARRIFRIFPSFLVILSRPAFVERTNKPTPLLGVASEENGVKYRENVHWRTKVSGHSV